MTHSFGWEMPGRFTVRSWFLFTHETTCVLTFLFKYYRLRSNLRRCGVRPTKPCRQCFYFPFDPCQPLTPRCEPRFPMVWCAKGLGRESKYGRLQVTPVLCEFSFAVVSQWNLMSLRIIGRYRIRISGTARSTPNSSNILIAPEVIHMLLTRHLKESLTIPHRVFLWTMGWCTGTFLWSFDGIEAWSSDGVYGYGVYLTVLQWWYEFWGVLLRKIST